MLVFEPFRGRTLHIWRSILTVSTEGKPYHALDAASVLASLNSNRRGLTKAEAAQRLERFGPNELAEKGGVSPWRLWCGRAGW